MAELDQELVYEVPAVRRGRPPKTVEKAMGRPGRPKGAVTKVTADIRKVARVYTKRALQTLLTVMEESPSDQARVAAAKEILDRGHGKSTQPLSSDPDNPLAANLYTLQIFALPGNGREDAGS